MSVNQLVTPSTSPTTTLLSSSPPKLSSSPPKTSITIQTPTASVFSYPKTAKKYEFTDDDETKTVRVAKCLDNDEMVAIKRISFKKENETIEDLMKETQIAKSMKHDNVLKYCTSFPVANHIWLVTKFLDGGSLMDTINFRMRALNAKRGVLDEITIATIMKEVLTGLEYFHSNGYVHRDIKAANILVGLDGSIQIADYGVSASMEDTEEKNEFDLVGTICWIAPEMLKHNGYDTRVDIWSLGITAIELATGKPPYVDKDAVEMLKILDDDNSPPPTLEVCEEEKDQYKGYSQIFRNFVGCCLKRNPKERASATELLKHEFINYAKDKVFISKYLALPADLRNYEVQEPLDVPATANCKWVKSNDRWGVVIIPDKRSSSSNFDNANENQSGNGSSNDSCEVQLRNIDKKRIRSKSVSVQPLYFVLKIRDEKKELTNIKFDFIPGKDTPERISQDLVAEKIIDGTDLITIACYLQKLLDNPSLTPITFQVKSGVSPGDTLDEKQFYGFAQLHYLVN